jgi:hypothetical protein
MNEKQMSQKLEINRIDVAVERTGLSSSWILHCVESELVSPGLGERDLDELRRIRRLVELGVNSAGIEVILHMRRQIIELRAQLGSSGHPPRST